MKDCIKGSYCVYGAVVALGLPGTSVTPVSINMVFVWEKVASNGSDVAFLIRLKMHQCY